MQDAFSFSEDAARRIVRGVRLIEGQSKSAGSAPTRDRLSRGETLVQLVAQITGNRWTANEVDLSGVTVLAITGGRTWDATDPIIIIGPPAKAGLVMTARKIGNYSGVTTWIADGYEWRVMDFGTGAQAPFIFESGTMKMKTLKTDDGITWTAEKIDISDEEC